jgi:hypothetical protein
MRKNFIFRVAFSVFAFTLVSLMSVAQTKNVSSTRRVFPKMDKMLEFEKAVALHAQKYHSGDATWRVFQIQSGPDAGGFQIVEGPTSWDALDSRGNMGTDHNVDWNKSVAVFLTDRMSASYAVYIDSLSTIALGDFADKINISHVYPKVGQGDQVVQMIKKLLNHMN